MCYIQEIINSHIKYYFTTILKGVPLSMHIECVLYPIKVLLINLPPSKARKCDTMGLILLCKFFKYY